MRILESQRFFIFRDDEILGLKKNVGFSWLLGLGQMYLFSTEKMKKHKFPARWAGTVSKFILLKYGRLKQKKDGSFTCNL